MVKKTQTPKDPKKPVLDESGLALERPKLNNPALLFLLVALPLLFGVMYAFTAPSSPAERAAVVAEAKQTRKYGRAMPDEVAAKETVQPAPESANVACQFGQYVGQKPSPEIEATIKAAGKMLRVLPPGSMMTMDYSADRVNFELDDQGVIQRVFCG